MRFQSTRKQKASKFTSLPEVDYLWKGFSKALVCRRGCFCVGLSGQYLHPPSPLYAWQVLRVLIIVLVLLGPPTTIKFTSLRYYLLSPSPFFSSSSDQYSPSQNSFPLFLLCWPNISFLKQNRRFKEEAHEARSVEEERVIVSGSHCKVNKSKLF